MQYLKADTATTVIIGPLAGSLSADEVSLWKHNNTTEIDISGTANITQVSNQMYSVDLATGNLDTEGRLNLYIRDDSESIHYAQEFIVVNANVYDSLFAAAGTDKLQVDLTQIDGQATNGYNATLKLKQLNIQNSEGTAFISKSTGGNGSGVELEGNSAGNAMNLKGNSGAAIRIWGGGSGIEFLMSEKPAIYAISKGFIEYNGSIYAAAPAISLTTSNGGGEGIKIVSKDTGIQILSRSNGIYCQGGYQGVDIGHGAYFGGGEGGGDGIRAHCLHGSQSGIDGIKAIGAFTGDLGHGMALAGGEGGIYASEINTIKNDASASKEQATLSRKTLNNKAVQNKSTGVIEYYDDDDETVILTHTPTDTESEITRNAS